MPTESRSRGDDVSVDAALLDLGSAPRPPGTQPRVIVGGAAGVWRDFDLAGPAAGRPVQLDWEREVGTLPGQSGGPVIEVNAATSAVVGVLVAGSVKGRFDRFLPLTEVRRCWPDLPRPWLMAWRKADSGRGIRIAGPSG